MKKIILTLMIIAAFAPAFTQRKKQPEIGIAESLSYDSLMAASGYLYLVESVGKLISPKSVSEEQFEKNVLLIKALKTPLYAVNIFMPGDMKLVGSAIAQTQHRATHRAICALRATAANHCRARQ